MRSFLRTLRHAPLKWWLCTLATSVLIGVIVMHTVATARTETQRYGNPLTVSVAARDLQPGDVIRRDDVRTETRAAAQLPAAPRTVHAIGAIAQHFIAKNEVLHDGNIGAIGQSATAALLHDSERGIAIGHDDQMLRVHVGDIVDVIGTYDSASTSNLVDKTPARTIVRSARVLHADDTQTVLAVPETQAEVTAFALTHARVVLSLSTVSSSPSSTPGS